MSGRDSRHKIGDSIAKLRDDLTRDIGAVRGDLDDKVEGLHTDLRRDIQSSRDPLGPPSAPAACRGSFAGGPPPPLGTTVPGIPSPPPRNRVPP